MNNIINCKLVSGHIQYDGTELDNLPDQDMILITKIEWDRMQYILVNQKRMLNKLYWSTFNRVLYPQPQVKEYEDDNTNN